MKIYKIVAILLMTCVTFSSAITVEKWHTFEHTFKSSKEYDNALYDVNSFKIIFTSPSGRIKNLNGFWDGGDSWKVRFCPDEIGQWGFICECSDKNNSGLNGQKGSFMCVANTSAYEIYQRGVIVHPKGEYHMTYSDGTPFFWVACTAWNGALRSQKKEWDYYLNHRKTNGYSVIQFVTTQWRGCDKDRDGNVAFSGSGRISINVDFFHRMDMKVKRVNDMGLVAAPVLLWALPFGQGMELSPGYYLPVREAILLARYMVARFGGYHVIWILGGDGKYVEDFEQRWKNIGRGVFGDEHPGLVTLHPMGRSWIGNDYNDEEWMDIIGYQSSHSNQQRTVDWITKGPIGENWYKLTPRPIINMEPNYEEIHFEITDKDVRNASYWSLFAAPISGITYGANGIWPWIYEGEKILNHRDAGGVTSWEKSLDFPGSLQTGYLSHFIQSLEWWRFKPAGELLVEQPGDSLFNYFISVAKTDNDEAILAYLPVKSRIKLYNVNRYKYNASWFDPVKNETFPAKILYDYGIIQTTSPRDNDLILILKKQ